METRDASSSDSRRRGLTPTRLAVGAITILVLALLAYGLVQKPAMPPQTGGPVPEFRLTAVDATPMDLSAQRGKIVVLNFFASWCTTCRDEAADLQLVWSQYQGRDVQFFGIAYKDAASKAQAFLQEFDVTYPFTAEPGNRTARAYGVTGVPETFVIDRAGNLVRHFIGPVSQEELSHELEQLVHE